MPNNINRIERTNFGYKSINRWRDGTNYDLIKSLEQKACLDGRIRGLDCLDWSLGGDLLVSCRTDNKVIVWDTHRLRERFVVKTGHTKNIACVKFMPGFNGAGVATCSRDGSVRLTDVNNDENIFMCKSHLEPTGIAVHPSEPNLIWSVSWMGVIAQHDIRQASACIKYSQTNEIHANCIAANPMRSEILAVGFGDACTRLLDRRAGLNFSSKSCIAHFAPVDLVEPQYEAGIKSLAFNHDGSELLASCQWAHSYLYNTNEPYEKYLSFDLNVKPLLFDEQKQKEDDDEDDTCALNSNPLKPYSYLRELQKQRPFKMSKGLKKLCDKIISSDRTLQAPRHIVDYIHYSVAKGLREESMSFHDRYRYTDQLSYRQDNLIDYLNVLLDRVSNCPELYRARAMALRRRAWCCDYYQSLRDCYCALALKPLDFKTIRCLATTLIKLGDREEVRSLLNFVTTMIKKLDINDADSPLIRTEEMLESFMQMPRTGYLYSTTGLKHLEHQRDKYLSEVHPDSCDKIFDYSRRYCGQRGIFRCPNAQFFGGKDEFVVSVNGFGICIMDKNTTNIVATFDASNLSIALPHPSICMLAACGTADAIVRLWCPSFHIDRDD